MDPTTISTSVRNALRTAARAHGFAVEAPKGLLPLSLYCGIPVDDLRAYFAGESDDFAVVAQLATRLKLQLDALVGTTGRPRKLLCIFPYHGGEPVYITSPFRLLPGELGNLFYLQVAAGGTDYRTGMPQHTLFICTRSIGPYRRGTVYVLSSDEDELIVRCSAVRSDGVVLFQAYDETRSFPEPLAIEHAPEGSDEGFQVVGRLRAVLSPASTGD